MSEVKTVIGMVGMVGIVAICVVELWVLVVVGARALFMWHRLRRARRAMRREDFGSSEESKAFYHLYETCVRYRDQTDSRDLWVATDAIIRELPRLHEAAFRYKKEVILSHSQGKAKS